MQFQVSDAGGDTRLGIARHDDSGVEMKRNRFETLVAAVVALSLAVPVLTGAVNVAPASAADGCTGVATTALDSLCVESSTNGPSTPPYNDGVVAGQRITTFKWLLNEDSTGDPTFNADNVAACLPSRAKPSPAALASDASLQIYATAGDRPLSDCPWPSVHASPGHSTVVASGDNTDIASLANVADGKYLISVTSVGFKIDGIHFEVRNGAVFSVNEEVGHALVVRMNPLPKKTATVRIHVFNDNASTNGQWDGQTETLVTCADATPVQVAANCGGSTDPNLIGDPSTDMSGFTVHITDVLAETTTDVYGNPLCTQYQTDGSGNILLNDDGTPNPITFAGADNVANAIPSEGGASGGALAGTESSCISDHYGDIVIPNMGPNRYAATVIPPDPRTHNGDQWVQTTTLEGGHDWDTWNIEGGTGYDTELIVGGERVSPVAHGFVKLTHPDPVWKAAEAAGAGSGAEQAYYSAGAGFSDPANTTNKAGGLSGSLVIGRAYIGSGGATPLTGTNLANAKEDGPITDGLISVSCLATCNAPTDTTVWTGRARADGSFDVTGLETGDYSVAFWDESQSYILAALQYSVVSGQVTDTGHVLLAGWFTDLRGTVFNDLNGDGKRDPGEPGIPDFVLTERTRGNSLQDQGAAVAVTNDEGEYDLSQGYPLGQFLIAEAYNPRYKNTGFTYTTDNDPTPHTVQSAQVDVDFLPVIGLSAHLDWGVQAYGTGTDYWSGDTSKPAPRDENGGIVGTVTYDVTRNEFDPAYSAQEDYQPGVSGISMQLWKTHKTDGVHADTYPGSGAVQQWGIKAGGAPCMRPDSIRGTNAVTTAGQDCKPYDYYVTESWTRPTGCAALDVNGNPLQGEFALPDAPADVDYSHTDPAQPDCVESPMSGFQIGGEGTVDGNYALTSLVKGDKLGTAITNGVDLEQFYADAQNNPSLSAPLTSGDYVVEAVNPVDTINPSLVKESGLGGNTSPTVASPRKLYRFTDETAINVMTGDTYVPQDGFAASGDPGGGGYGLNITPDTKIRIDHNSLGAGTVANCAGSLWTVPSVAGQAATNPDLADAGGNPYAGRRVPQCDAKLVTVAGGRSMNPGFYMYTDVPIPSKFYGLVNDDLNVNVDRRSILLGEVAPASNVPVGVYDENGNWKMTAHSDVNGFYEILLPSMDTYNCPLPAGPCPNVYRLVGNDPGTLAHQNEDYNPQFRTIATEFQAWTGVVHPVDQAPTHNGITIEGPAAQFGALSLCALAPANPKLFAIDKPYFNPGTDASREYVIKGIGFGATGRLTLGSTNVVPTSWADTEIRFVLPANMTPGPYQLTIRNNTSQLSTVNGLTFHVLSPSSANNPTYLQQRDVYEVTAAVSTDDPSAHLYTPVHDAWDPVTNTPAGFFGTDVNGLSVGDANNTGADSPNGRAIQRAVQAAYRDGLRNNGTSRPKLVVIYPNTAANYAPHNPNAAYFENVVLHNNVKLQGVGPGGVRSATDSVSGTNIDASQFWSATQVVPPGANQDTSDGSYADDWRTFANALPRFGSGPADLPEGEGVLAIAQTANQNNLFFNAFRPGVDGTLLTGGDQQGNPGNINTLPGAIGDTVAGPTNPGPAQGGAIMADQYVRDFNITNNQVQSNGGTYGTLRIGTPDLPGSGDNHNERLVVANNRIIANGGTNLAGALGIFAGASNYSVTGNDFCGNFSAEYGGAISHYGLSANGLIARNRIYYNQGYDEGGGIMIAGALPANTSTLSPGAGKVTIDSNTLISNQSNDDGGGIRFLMAGTAPFLVQNNIIANNLSTHEGGGIALDDSPNVTLVNNTIVKNITTATAATNGALGDGVKPANPAGLSSGGNSPLLQAILPAGSPNWSKPKLLNNLFADNRAGWAVLPTATSFNESAIHGIGDPLDSDAIQRWDIGVSNAAGLNNGSAGVFGFDGLDNTTNATTTPVHADPAAASYVGGLTNIDPSIDGTGPAADGGIGFVNPQNFLVDSLMWRTNTTVSYPVIVAHMVPITLLADYHLLSPATGLALDAGAASLGAVSAPGLDIDGEIRPGGPSIDRGADELATKVDFAIAKTATKATAGPGDSIGYTLTATNGGPATGQATVVDTVPTGITGTWACTGTLGAVCPVIPAGSNLNANVTLPANAVATFTFVGTVSNTVTPGVKVNTATIAPRSNSGATDTDPTNNSASATVSVQVTGNLAVAISGAGTTVTRGQVLPYVITISNPSTHVMQEHFSTSHVGSFSGLGGWSCATTGPAGSSCNGLAGLGDIGDRVVTVMPGGTVRFTYVNSGFFGVSVPTGAAFGSTLNVTATLDPSVAGYVDTNAADNSASLTSTVVARLNLALTNVVTGASNPQGSGNYTYTVRVTNTGADAASGVPLSDPVPAGVEFVGWTCASTGGGTATTNCGGATTGNSGPISRTLNVPSGGSVTFTVTARRVTSPLTHGPVSNTATASEPPFSNQAAVSGSPASASVTFS